MYKLHPDTEDSRGYLDAAGVQQYLGIGRSLAYQLLRSEACPSVRVGKRLLVHRDALDAWLTEHGRAG